MTMHVTVVGAGGIGCALAYVLRRAGVEVALVEADDAKIAWGRAQGLAIAGSPPIDVALVPFRDWTPMLGSLHLLCVKCYDNAAVLARLPADAIVVPVQNGFDPQLFERTHTEGIASFVSECDPGTTRTRITRGGDLHLGHHDAPDPSGVAALDFLVTALAAAPFRVVRVDRILPYKHAKLLYNAAISPLATAAGLDNGELLRHAEARPIFFDLLRENYDILAGAGLPLAKIGPFHPDTVQKILRRRWLARMLSWCFYPSLRGTYCSMFHDLPKGRTEIDNYNGHLIRLAGERPCPLNRKVVALLQRMLAEKCPPSLTRLQDLRR
jgi:2-dehydropantoate 2-reductase